LTSAVPHMQFTVDAWDPSYGVSVELEDGLGESTARLEPGVELPQTAWRAMDAPPGVPRPPRVLFVDGVRRIDARVWVTDTDHGGSAAPGLCGSLAAGVICCCNLRAHLVQVESRRGLFTVAPHAVDIVTSAGDYPACHTPAGETPPPVALSLAMQRRLAEIEVVAATTARQTSADHGLPDNDDLLVVDGPLRGRQHLPRAIGYIKSHAAGYLPAHLHSLVGSLRAGQRTPVFLIGTSWDRHTWYLRLPCRAGAPWTGVVRIECSADMKPTDAIELANLSQATLCRYASAEYKDPRAPQNLYPIAGLERELRRRLGDSKLLHRALRMAAATNGATATDALS
jgi:hypothetical protein